MMTMLRSMTVVVYVTNASQFGVSYAIIATHRDFSA